MKGFFAERTAPALTKSPQDLLLSITIPPAEALSGTQKKISYKVGDETVSLLVQIPPNTASGKKLRIREKGNRVNGGCGDLILTVNVGPVSS